MNTLTKTKTATVDAAFHEVSQDVIMSSAPAPPKSTKCDVTQVSASFARQVPVVIRTVMSCVVYLVETKTTVRIHSE